MFELTPEAEKDVCAAPEQVVRKHAIWHVLTNERCRESSSCRINHAVVLVKVFIPTVKNNVRNTIKSDIVLVITPRAVRTLNGFIIA